MTISGRLRGEKLLSKLLVSDLWNWAKASLKAALFVYPAWEVFGEPQLLLLSLFGEFYY